MTLHFDLSERDCIQCGTVTTALFCSVNCKYTWKEKNPDKRITFEGKVVSKIDLC